MSAIGYPVWLITGCSTGFGKELAKLVIARGWNTAVTARDKSRVENLVAGHQDNTLTLNLDVTNIDQIHAAVDATEERFGRIDVLVNNAGYGYMTSVEEGEEVEIRKQFDANVFGLFAVTRAVLPIMRRQRSGHIVNVTSVAGLVGFAASGYYAASKHAVEGWSDSLAAEVTPLGIKVTCVEPGPFRTDWAGRSNVQTPNMISDYAETTGVRLANIKRQSGKQPGDPVRVAEAIVRITRIENPPRYLVLGAFGMDAVTKKLTGALNEINQWRELALSADYPNP
jgi:NAD(P)-dependent dehydrogenase (short-subunit alcohol dehydrogenase family)